MTGYGSASQHLKEVVPCKRNCTCIQLEKDSSAASSPDLFHLSCQEQRAPACQLPVKCKVFHTGFNKEMLVSILSLLAYFC